MATHGDPAGGISGEGTRAFIERRYKYLDSAAPRVAHPEVLEFSFVGARGLLGIGCCHCKWKTLGGRRVEEVRVETKIRQPSLL